MNVQELKNRMVMRARDSLASYTQITSGSTGGIDIWEINALFGCDLMKELFFSLDHKSVIKAKKISLEMCEDNAIKEYLQQRFEKCQKDGKEGIKFGEWVAQEQINIITRLRTMMRRNREMVRETGVDCLRIGFPYVIGRFMDANNRMDIFRAPLFVVTIEMETNKAFNGINLMLKDDLQLNTALSEKMIYYGAPALPSEFCDNMSNSFSDLYANKKNEKAFVYFWNKTCELIEQNLLAPIGLSMKDYKINNVKTLCNQFKNVALARDDLHGNDVAEQPVVKQHAVLGMFRLNSQEIINDLNDWTDGDKYLSGLEKNQLDLFDPVNYDYKESDLVQVGNLDNSQKFAIIKALSDNCVIYGPPGTGKSATITNLLVNILHQQKQAVFCAEKRVATDVVYNRLGKYRVFTLVLHDLIKDRVGFYAQLRTNIDQMRQWFGADKQRLDDLEDINKKMDGIFKQSQQAQELLQGQPGQDYIKCLRKHPMPTDYAHEIKSWVKRSEMFNVTDYSSIQTTLRHLIDLRHQYQSYITIPSDHRLILDNFDRIEMLAEFDWDEAADAELSAAHFVKGGKLRTKLGWLAKKQAKKVEWGQQISIVQQINYIKTHKSMLLKLADLSQGDNVALMADLQSLHDEDLLVLLEKCYIVSFEKANQKLLLFATTDWQSEIKELLFKKTELEKDAWPMHYGTAIIKELKSRCDKSEEFRSKYNNFYKTLTQTQRLRSIKIFYNEYRDIIQLVCPIMISSIDIAVGLLPLKPGIVDYAVFDEASQIFLERAMTLCYRAKLVSVAGDDKQLQPTNFFIRDLDSDDEWVDSNEWYQPGDFVSLLNLAKHVFNDYRLSYHYRSQYIELIYFSDINFYNSELLVCNSNCREMSYQPIEIVKVAGKWENQVNDEEATKIVEMTINLVHESNRAGQATIGIITFNKKQAELIMRRLIKASDKDELLDLALNNPDPDRAIFVKNIEDVQGEERDIILFSFAFAYNKKNGFSRNFGPINKANGEYRINVAISRARLKVYIICSILSSDILRDSNLSVGAQTLGRYLKYCELLQNNRFDQPIIKTLFTKNDGVDKQPIKQQVEIERFLGDDISLSLENAIDNKVYQIQRNLVQAGFVIDLAVWDKIQQKYVLAVNCDQYITAKEVPDKARDYYLEAMLESKGWNCLRIDAIRWWHQDQKEIIDLIIKKFLKK